MMKFRSILAVLMLVLLLLPVTAFANGLVPMPQLVFECEDLPEGTVYVDLLIYLPESDSMYTNDTGAYSEEISESAPLVTWCEDDYRSYTFHYSGAESAIKPDSHGIVQFQHADEIRARGNVRLVMADDAGNILKVSPLLSLEPERMFYYSLNAFRYNAATDTFVAESAFSAISVLMYLLLSFCGIVFTCLSEWLVSIPFGLNRRYGWMIVRTNVLSQIVMRGLFVVLYGVVFKEYVYTMIVLEILVYVCEFIFYRWKMKDISLVKCICYTVVANTASLLIGGFVNQHIGW